ncbi:MAG: hypothetical protein DWQ02_04660 [Bacteroidetes bacterium]|nr:MAG: hypothetical protein DWQ02_04660 [Bacteroidota bacterium]
MEFWTQFLFFLKIFFVHSLLAEIIPYVLKTMSPLEGDESGKKMRSIFDLIRGRKPFSKFSSPNLTAKFNQRRK